MSQQIEQIQDCKLATSKNAKLFYDTHKCLYYAVHYDHVVLTVDKTVKQVLSVYYASPTSLSVIYDVLNYLEIENIGVYDIYKQLGILDQYPKSQRKTDYFGATCRPRFTKKDWEYRKRELKKYDYKLGAYLYQESGLEQYEID